MEEHNKQDQNQPKKETTAERLRREQLEREENAPKFDIDGGLIIKLTMNDSALIVRENGSVEMVSHELEKHEDGFIGDIEDLNNTFSLVLALASALENEELYNRIFHNLNMSLMNKWTHLSDDIKSEIVQRRNKAASQRSEKENEEKQKRIDDFRKRMNKYKETFLDDLEAEKRRLQRDMQDEAEWLRTHGTDFKEADVEPEEPNEYTAPPEDMFERMESRPKKKIKKKKITLPSRNTDWNPYDKTLVRKRGNWRLDAPPPEESDE